ncbi:MAG: hypothetical protein D6722_05240 [Bacteroidetes bacterium]|nr:MAG: hypothetical protein D6722_05240 [Bacteroidota bacterium]
MKPHAYIALCIACLSCQQAPPPITLETVTIDSLYAIDLPSNLQPGYDMHDYASLQYYDMETGFYVLGLEDTKEKLGDIKRKRLKLPGYFRFVENTVFERADSVGRVGFQSYVNDYGVPLRLGDYYVEGENWARLPLFYRIAVYENDTYYFQLVIWMPEEGHCERFTWVDTITRSFRFLDGSGKVAARRP